MARRIWLWVQSLWRSIDWNVWHWLRLPSLGDIRALREANEKARSDSQSLLVQRTDDIRSLLAQTTNDVSVSLKEILAHCLQTGNNVELANEQMTRLAESLQKALQKKTDELSSCLMSSFGKLGENVATQGQLLSRDYGIGNARLESRFDELLAKTREVENSLLEQGKAGFERLAEDKDAFRQSAEAFFANGSETLGGLAKQAELTARQIEEFIAIAQSLREVFDLFLVNNLIDKLETSKVKTNHKD